MHRCGNSKDPRVRVIAQWDEVLPKSCPYSYVQIAGDEPVAGVTEPETPTLDEAATEPVET